MNKEPLQIDWPNFIRWYNLTLKQYGSVIPELVVISPGKKAQVQRIVNRLGSKELLMTAVIKMAKSDFLNGRRRDKWCTTSFVASFPWLTDNDERIADLVNGKYDNPPVQELTPEERRRQELEAREAERQRQREENRRIEEEERERRRRQREYDAAHAATPEEVERITAGFHLPPLRPEDRTPHERIFGKISKTI